MSKTFSTAARGGFKMSDVSFIKKKKGLTRQKNPEYFSTQDFKALQAII